MQIHIYALAYASAEIPSPPRAAARFQGVVRSDAAAPPEPARGRRGLRVLSRRGVAIGAAEGLPAPRLLETRRPGHGAPGREMDALRLGGTSRSRDARRARRPARLDGEGRDSAGRTIVAEASLLLIP